MDDMHYNFEIPLFCPAHPFAATVENVADGDMICTQCGLVVMERCVDMSAEWRNFSDKGEPDRSRVGGPETGLFDNELTTIIGPPKQTPGKPVPVNTTQPTVEQRTNKSMSANDRSLLSQYREVYEMASRISLPKSIIDRCTQLIKQLNKGRLLMNSSKDAKCAACLYIACRQEGAPRTFKEICALSRSGKKEIGRCFKRIIKLLQCNINVIDSSDYMARFCGVLGLSAAVQRLAEHIAYRSYELSVVSGRCPISVAAASIFIAADSLDERRNVSDIASLTGVSEVTIKILSRDLESKFDELIMPIQTPKS